MDVTERGDISYEGPTQSGPLSETEVSDKLTMEGRADLWSGTWHCVCRWKGVRVIRSNINWPVVYFPTPVTCQVKWAITVDSG